MAHHYYHGLTKTLEVMAAFSLLMLLPKDLFFHIDKTDRKPVNRFNIDSAYQGKEWRAPSLNEIPADSKGAQIQYGRDLIAHTAVYFGPRGMVATTANGMNCQNCHLEAGTKAWGNNYSAVFSGYPRFRERSGTNETIVKRVNDCFERSLNGQPLDSVGKEMQAIVAYISWLGAKVPKGVQPKGSGIRALAFMDRAADTAKGRMVFINKCRSCHGNNGEGWKDKAGVAYIYPPLWGANSYTTAAGLYRLSRFAGYVKDNMPFGASHYDSKLKDEEAWDVAAFVNSRPRPHKRFVKDWPNIAGKPIDYPYGPYADSFSERQHKYGPFAPLKKAKEEALALQRKQLPALKKN